MRTSQPGAQRSTQGGGQKSAAAVDSFNSGGTLAQDDENMREDAATHLTLAVVTPRFDGQGVVTKNLEAVEEEAGSTQICQGVCVSHSADGK